MNKYTILYSDGNETNDVPHSQRIQIKVNDINQKLKILEEQSKLINYESTNLNNLRTMTDRINNEMIKNLEKMDEIRNSMEMVKNETQQFRKETYNINNVYRPIINFSNIREKIKKMINEIIEFIKKLFK